MQAAVLREKRDRRNLAVLIAIAVNQPKDIDKVAPAEKQPRKTKQQFEEDAWWQGA